MRGREEFASYAKGAVTGWVSFARRSLLRLGYSSEQAGSEATLLVATVRGLLLDLLATGERARVDVAMEEFVDQIHRRTQKAGGKT